MDSRFAVWLLPNLLTELVLVFTFHRVWRTSRERYLFIWTLAFVVWSVRYAWGIVQPAVVAESPGWVLPAFAYGRGTLLVWGGAEMVGRRIRWIWWVALGVAGAWLFLAPLPESDPWVVAPTYAVYAAGLLWVARLLATVDSFPALERHLAAWPMAFYAMIQVTYPWATSTLRPLAPAVFVLAAVTQLAFVLGILLIHFRRAERRLEERHRALADVLRRALAGHMSVCPGCQSIRDEQGSWLSLEQYVNARSGTLFSHGICPGCVEAHYDF